MLELALSLRPLRAHVRIERNDRRQPSGPGAFMVENRCSTSTALTSPDVLFPIPARRLWTPAVDAEDLAFSVAQGQAQHQQPIYEAGMWHMSVKDGEMEL